MKYIWLTLILLIFSSCKSALEARGFDKKQEEQKAVSPLPTKDDKDPSEVDKIAEPPANPAIESEVTDPADPSPSTFAINAPTKYYTSSAIELEITFLRLSGEGAFDETLIQQVKKGTASCQIAMKDKLGILKIS